MPVTIEATVGGASSNSYLTLAEAQAIADSLILNDQITAWDAASTDTKNRALVNACWRIDRERFFGYRSSDSQALQWPRTNVKKPDQYRQYAVTGFSSPYLNSQIGCYFLTDEIPDQIKKAQAILAIYLVSEPDALGLTGLEQFQSVSVGPLSVTPKQPQDPQLLPPLVEQYLRGLRANTSVLSIVRN